MVKKDKRNRSQGTVRKQSGPRRVGEQDRADLGSAHVFRRGEVRSPNLEHEKCDIFPIWEKNVYIAILRHQDRRT